MAENDGMLGMGGWGILIILFFLIDIILHVESLLQVINNLLSLDHFTAYISAA